MGAKTELCFPPDAFEVSCNPICVTCYFEYDCLILEQGIAVVINQLSFLSANCVVKRSLSLIDGGKCGGHPHISQ